jgi:hypothetical protein
VSYAFKLDPENTWNVGLEYMAGGDRSSALPALTTKYVHQSGSLQIERQWQTDLKNFPILSAYHLYNLCLV